MIWVLARWLVSLWGYGGVSADGLAQLTVDPPALAAAQKAPCP